MRYGEGKLKRKKSLGEGEREKKEKMKMQGSWASIFLFKSYMLYTTFESD